MNGLMMPFSLRAAFTLALLGGFLALTALGRQEAGPPAVGLDHVILGIDELDRGIERFAALTGVVPVRGGEHPGRGTQNALVSLGEHRYLEILAPSASASRTGRDPRTRYAELTPAGWALHTRTLDDRVKRLRAAGFETEGPTPGSRRTLEGDLLAWRTAAAAGTGLELAPFFIEWAEGSAHPSATSPGGCKLISLELTAPDPARLRTFFDAAGYGATVHAGPATGMQLVLECPRGRVSFPN